MKIFKNLFIIISIIIIAISFTGVNIVNANNSLSSIDDKIEEAEKELAATHFEQSELLTEIGKLTDEIQEYESEIKSLNKEIEELEKNIKTKGSQIEEKEELYDLNYEKFKVRLVASYESGTVSYLDVILSSKSIIDALSNVQYINEIIAADNEFLEDLERQKRELENVKIGLENDKKAIEQKKENVEDVSNSLKASQTVKESYLSQLNEEEKEIQAEIEQFEEDKAELQAFLEAQAAASGSYEVQEPNEYGYISPLPGRSAKSDLSCGWYGYPGHRAIDYAYWGINEDPIVAVKAGEVIISDAQRYSNGSYRSYGEYIVIDHLDGSTTLYAHGSPGSRKVSVGDYVGQGQTIMLVGTTGNSTGPHLHFEVRINGTHVNPTYYVP